MTPAEHSSQAIWVSGPRAVGKSSVGWEVFLQAHQAGVPAAYVDLAQIGFLNPASEDDRRTLIVANLAGLWQTYRADGAELLIISGSADPATVAAVRELGVFDHLVVASLRTGDEQRRSRIADRAAGRGAHLPGDDLIGLSGDALAAVTAWLLAAPPVPESTDLVIDTERQSAAEVARRLLSWSGQPSE